MAENLKVYFNNQKALYDNQRSEAAAELAQVNTDLQALIDSHALLVTAYAEQERTIAAKRSAMADEDLMPADLQVLVDELRQLLIDQRAARVGLLAVEDQIAVLENERDALGEQIDLIDSRISDAASDLETASEQAETHAAWALKVSDGELADLQSSIGEVLAIIDGGALPAEPADELVAAATARARFEADIPEILRDHAAARGGYLQTQIERRQTQLAALRQALADQQATDSGVSGALAQALLAYDIAETAYADVVARGDGRALQAQSLLDDIAASPELTSAESDRIATVALAADDDALVKEAARDAAQAEVAEKIVEIEDAITAALIANISADPESVDEVSDKRDELIPLESALATAEGEFDSAMQQALALWQAAVPEGIWNNFVNYNSAVATLRELAAADVTALGTAFDDAETALIEALGNDDEALRRLDALQARGVMLQGRLDDLEDRRGAHHISAVRGDDGYHTSLVQGEIL